MTSAVGAAVGRAGRRTRVARPRSVTGLVVPAAAFVALAGCYGLIGADFAAHGAIVGDALSRVVDAQSVLFGRDPHLAAIGFVFGPLPTLLELPLVALRGPLPAMVTAGGAGIVMSSCFAAAAVWQAYRFARERDAELAWSLLAAGGLAVNPLFVIYAANGMSESPFVCVLLAAARRLARWSEQRRASELVAAGCWLGVGYLIRYEAVIAGAGAVVFVGLLSSVRRSSAWRRELGAIATDVGLLLGPLLLSFAVFAGLSWWLTGDAMAQFNSEYGNAAIIAASGTLSVPATNAALVTHQLFALAPAAGVLVPLYAGVLLGRRDWAMAAFFAVLGSVGSFEILSMTAGTTFVFLRYLIVVVPLVSVGGLVLRPWGRLGLAILAACILTGMLGTWRLLASDHYAPQEAPFMETLRTGDPVPDASGLTSAREVADWLESQPLGPRALTLTDSVFGFTVLSQTTHPDRFVIPSDRDYDVVIDRPYQSGVRYLLTVPPVGRGLLDAINRYYPGMFAGCVTNTRLAMVADGDGNPSQWRVYELLGPISPATARRVGPCREARDRLP
jgi:Dolichyl-phosphate-mannose-protein mannosyltransferase